MKKDDSISRREFQRLTLAAVSGLAVGANLRISLAHAAEPRKSLIVEPHVCRGLNTCKGLGKSTDNACAGRGTCASAVPHECAGKNECKGQGGCGMFPGENDCGGHGLGKVPLATKAWKKARFHFEEEMQRAGKKFGPAPAKSGENKG